MAVKRTRSEAAKKGWETRRIKEAAKIAEREKRSAAAVLGHKRRRERLEAERGTTPAPVKAKPRKPRKPRKGISPEQWAAQQIPSGELSPVETIRKRRRVKSLKKYISDKEISKHIVERRAEIAVLQTVITRIEDQESGDPSSKAATENWELLDKYYSIMMWAKRDLRKMQVFRAKIRKKSKGKKKRPNKFARPPEYFGDIKWEDLQEIAWQQELIDREKDESNRHLENFLIVSQKDDRLTTEKAQILMHLLEAADKGILYSKVLEIANLSDKYSATELYSLYMISTTPV